MTALKESVQITRFCSGSDSNAFDESKWFPYRLRAILIASISAAKIEMLSDVLLDILRPVDGAYTPMPIS